MDEDHLQFDPYGLAPPEGDWDYEVDDWGNSYGPGWWPFYRNGKPNPVRLAPNTLYYAWRNMYVSVWSEGGAQAGARISLYVRKQGLGVMLHKTAPKLTFDLRTETFTVAEHCPPEFRLYAEAEAARILRALLAARAERRSGKTQPTTAHDRYQAAREAAGGV